MDEFEEGIHQFLSQESEPAIYVKAESIELRAHLLQLLLPHWSEAGPEAFLEALKKIEEYVKYGK